MKDQAIQQIKDRLNIADVVRRYVDLRPVSGRWMGACPFHQETKPSMSVNEVEGFFYCFGCQASGDVIDFYMRINGLDFKDAIAQLADEAGVELGQMSQDPQAQEQRQRKKLYLEMHEAAQAFFSRNLNLPVGAQARQYLEKRGMSPDTIQQFGLGAVPDDWHGLDHFLQSKGYKPEQGVGSGLLSSNEKGSIYDRFRGRLIFPIHNLAGKVVAFGGRILGDGEPKYLNSSESDIYIKGEHLYGLHVARTSMARTRRALLTEGYMDVLSLHQFGYKDACGVLGTALTNEQVKRLAGFCSRVDLVFDGDGAGRKAAHRSAEMILLMGVACRVVLLPDGEDVDSLLQEKGNAGFDDCLESAEDGLAFWLRTLREEFAPREIMDRAKGFLNKLEDSSLRAFYLPRIAAGLGLSEAEFRENAASARVLKQPDAPVQRDIPAVGKDDKDDRYFLKFPIQYPDYVPALDERGFMNILVTERAKNLWEKMVRYHGSDIMPWLDQGEKRFWVQCRMELERDSLLSGEELLAEWNYICGKITVGHDKNEKKRLMQALRSAQQVGDQKLVTEYTNALNVFLGRDNEQH